MRRIRAARLALVLALLAASMFALASPAPGEQSASLQATLTPEHLGQSTTIGFSFQITAPHGEVPAPLTDVEVRYPVDLQFALSELGLAHCTAITLESFGVPGCPPNSLMGYGTVTAEVALGPTIIPETAQVTILRTANEGEHVGLLIYAEAHTPVTTEVVMPALVLSANPPYGGGLSMKVPLLTVLPEGRPISIVKFRSTLGPQHINYYEYAKGHRIKFQPKGVPLPETCPHAGFRFAATFTFLDGTTTTTYATVPCPRAARHPR
ncbi:MAG TPA: hypothetical protein VHT29_02120 [Solirubrobacteraceae bacterium]|nr:hypothetical protein [Solirubrobacteraceae bacterium]